MSSTQARKLYYVYAIEDPRNGDIIYVGKGQGYRMTEHWRLMVNVCVGMLDTEHVAVYSIISPVKSDTWQSFSAAQSMTSASCATYSSTVHP